MVRYSIGQSTVPCANLKIKTSFKKWDHTAFLAGTVPIFLTKNRDVPVGTFVGSATFPTQQ